MTMDPLEAIRREVVACRRCPRLREYCKTVAIEKRKQFRDQEYWGRPVPGFGDPEARLLVVGLAPAAHGANRTGRMFTGDNSGLWLYRALFRAGFSSREKSEGREDGLLLRDAYITAIARCAPPANKPLPEEREACSRFLVQELEALKNIRVFLALGQIALRGLWRVLPRELKPSGSIPKFAHGLRVPLSDGRVLLCSYHPSQQNTFTKKLTEEMFDRVFREVKVFLRH